MSSQDPSGVVTEGFPGAGRRGATPWCAAAVQRGPCAGEAWTGAGRSVATPGRVAAVLEGPRGRETRRHSWCHKGPGESLNTPVWHRVSRPRSGAGRRVATLNIIYSKE